MEVVYLLAIMDSRAPRANRGAGVERQGCYRPDAVSVGPKGHRSRHSLSISDGIDVSVAAWEKRGYWVKADRFRMDWMWTGQYADKMKVAIFTDDWGTIAMLMPQIAQKFSKIEVSKNHRLGRPWEGALKQLTNGK